MEGRKEGRKKGLQPLKRRLDLSNFVFSRKNSLLLKGISREPDLDKLFNLMSFAPSLHSEDNLLGFDLEKGAPDIDTTCKWRRRRSGRNNTHDTKVEGKLVAWER